MAIRSIRINEDEILRKKCRTVDEINNRIKVLIKDMIDTMYNANGVGLAAPQVGILKRIFVIDVQDGNGVKVFINPEIIEKSGEYTDYEGCLSLPGMQSEVSRAKKVKVKALDENGEEFILEGEDFLAKAIQHENDHLDGILFTDYGN
ncbi:peptide deformylase [Clostridium tarantellae]|uniref:Peptide deformylase n=1 Tax=Clostridium tarantellae TaxID=39493 RepID=A0A6I1MID1_9CLOT|nr:peptide deformylase [Clostridium tarantellae]MPQ42453.1 peptide deformylase [Clostridium tarantellae]